MAFDEAKINIKSGDGGDGIVTFRREKYVPKGGPSGGDGGNGGDVVFRVNPKMGTLSYFQKKIHFKAKNGKRGGSANKTGASGDSLYIDVPPGTVIRDSETEDILADLVKPYEEMIIARGGRGGRGNARFTSASNQAPRFAEKGAPGIERWIKLELKLIADVGLVGVPNAGKSTLLSVISNAKPKIADYPFTTLEPNLGVVVYNDIDFVVADIPGLIEGAHMGVGLGHSFLRHVQRTRLLVHVLNGASDNVIADYSQINSELALYDSKLTEKAQIVVYNKIDLPYAEEQWNQVKQALLEKGVNAIPISAATQKNIQTLIRDMSRIISDLPQVVYTEPITKLPIYELSEDELDFEIEHVADGIFRVSGKRIERAAAMTYWDYEEAVLRFQDILETLGIVEALQNAGIHEGDVVYIGDHELEWSD